MHYVFYMQFAQKSGLQHVALQQPHFAVHGRHRYRSSLVGTLVPTAASSTATPVEVPLLTTATGPRRYSASNAPYRGQSGGILNRQYLSCDWSSTTLISNLPYV